MDPGEPSPEEAFESQILRKADQIPLVESEIRNIVKSGNETILVVEDDPSVRFFTQRTLAQLGYQVLAVSSPEDALKLCCDVSREVHLIVSDVVLPGMSGAVLMKKILGFKPDVKALYVTGFDRESAVKYGVDPVFDHMLVKPYKQEDLAGKVRELLGAERTINRV
jgi:CheY-like chemotaxis protein